MKKILFPILALVVALTLIACNRNDDTNDTNETSQQDPSEYDRKLVKFPDNYDKGVNYATVNRGNVREEAYTSREAIEAVQNGQPIPSGTVITLEIYEDEELSEIFVMEKRDGWGDQPPPPIPRVMGIGYTRNSMATGQWITRKTSVAALPATRIRNGMTL
ncbi:hypothetical protein [Priestia megaterium]|uniref:hypothetical protein n=1 Tax=Priestia megaterium TaxID=1404 RepID=UPI002E20EC77|nr:hypothetical protein [Priestia megaterium]